MVHIVGGGIAGLTAAVYLQKSGASCKLYEATDRVGGRVKTDREDGYLFDHGFQVMLDAYPETKALLDYSALELAAFGSGARVASSAGMKKVIDPTRHFAQGWSTPFQSPGTMGDLLKMNKLRSALKSDSLETIFSKKEQPTKEYLREKGFSDPMIEDFFKPFYGGIFLEDELKTSSRMFEYVFKMFGEGNAVLPKNGIGSITEQLAAKLSPDTIALNTRVLQDDKGQFLIDGLSSEDIVIDARSQTASEGWNHALCLYFSAPSMKEEFLYLDARANSPIKNVAVLSAVHASYAPQGKSLISVTLKDGQKMIPKKQDEVKQALVSMLSVTSPELNFLRHYYIPQALPKYMSMCLPKVAWGDAKKNSLKIGDITGYPSLNAAMASGRIAAELILQK